MFVTRTRTTIAAAAAAGLLLATASPVSAQDETSQVASRRGWTEGPHTGQLGDQATVDVPEGYYFLDKAATRAFLLASENVPSGNELGAVVRMVGDDEEGQSWFALFSFSGEGYVDDSDRDKIDADGLMRSMKAGTEADNEERKKRGWTPFNLEGWQTRPFYDSGTNNLTWAIRGSSPGDGVTINHSVRLLGRRGVMSVALVAGDEDFAAITDEFNELLSGYTYNPGQRYAEFRNGDKLAGYGLAALIGGGAAAAAVKTGFLQKAWKAIVALLVAAAAGLKKLFGGRKDAAAATVQPPPVPQ
jgi:uncharacterized membrane-anchored protein